MKPVLFGISLFFFLTVSGYALEPAAPAILKEVKGPVKLTRAAGRQVAIAKTGDALEAGDKLETLDKASVRIAFSDGSEVTLSGRTTWLLEGYSSSAGKVQNRSELAFGELRARTGKLPPGSSLEVRTPTSVAAVRGTDFLLQVYQFNEDLYTLLEVTEGVVEFSDLGDFSLKQVGAGQKATSTPPSRRKTGEQAASSPAAKQEKAEEEAVVKNKVSYEDEETVTEEEPVEEAVVQTSLKPGKRKKPRAE